MIKKQKRINEFWKNVKINKTLLIMLFPSLLFIILFSYIPMAGIVLAFENYNFKDRFFSPFVGLQNFKFIFLSGEIWGVIRNTVLYNLVFIFLNNILQVICALFFSQLVGKYFKKFAQSFMFLPHFISWVVVGAFAYNMFNYDNGLINSLVLSIGGEPIDFYNNATAWPGIIVALNAWKGVGYGSIVYLAAIMGLDQEMYEAATIDGAGVFQKIKYLTLPCLIPTFIILILLALGGIFKGNFEMFYQLIGNNSILLPTTDVIDTYVARALLQHSDVGMSAAAGLLQSVVGFIIVLFVNFLVKCYDKDYSLF